MVLATQLVLQKAFSLVSKSLAVRRVKAQASCNPFFYGFSARDQNRDGYKCKGSHSPGCVKRRCLFIHRFLLPKILLPLVVSRIFGSRDHIPCPGFP